MIARLLLISFMLSALSGAAQQVFRLEVEPFQQMETIHGAPGQLFDLPGKEGTVILAGQYDTEGLGQHLVFNGGRLLIDSMVIGPGGYRYVTLRREDGRDFYNMFPSLKATLVPLVDLDPDRIAGDY